MNATSEKKQEIERMFKYLYEKLKLASRPISVITREDVLKEMEEFVTPNLDDYTYEIGCEWFFYKNKDQEANELRWRLLKIVWYDDW